MSESKFVMAQKLYNVQKALMGMSIQDMSLDSLITLIFEKCSEENLTFWFNFYEHECVLNLRDIGHENYELNIRQYYETMDIDEVKLQVLVNAFHLTGDELTLENNENSSALQEEETPADAHIISGDKITPKPIRKAIDTIKAKGVEVNPTSIKNHVQWGQLSIDQRIKCTNYLKEMGAS